LPNPPMAVGSAGMYAISPDAVEVMRKASVRTDRLTLLDGVGVEAIGRLVDERKRDGRKDMSTDILLPCSCGHVLLAREPS
jgi:hypothetical protein